MRMRLLAIALSAGLGTPASAAMSDADCQAAWKAADANGNGVLEAQEAARYQAALRVANKPIPDKIDQAVFLENCKAGYFTTATAEAGAPFPGANSFTEGQARDRIVAAGFGDVSSLRKDDKGIWRGTAQLSGKSVNVAVDYKGNVVSN
jgi:hypothetical protein